MRKRASSGMTCMMSSVWSMLVVQQKADTMLRSEHACLNSIDTQREASCHSLTVFHPVADEMVSSQAKPTSRLFLTWKCSKM